MKSISVEKEATNIGTKTEVSFQLIIEDGEMKDKGTTIGSLLKPTPTSNIMEMKNSDSVVMTMFGYLLTVN